MEKFIEETFEGTNILFAVREINTNAILSEKSPTDGLQTHATSFSQSVTSRLNSIRSGIKDLVVGFGSDISSVKSSLGARSIELELEVSVSAEGKLIIGATTAATLKLKITWEN